MKDVLSQAQIDALIQSMGSSAEPVAVVKKEKVRDYDFKNPKKFTRDQIRLFEDIYGNFSKLVSLQLSDRLRTKCFIEVSYIEEQTFFEYTNSIPKSSLFGIYKSETLKGNVSIEISHSTANSIISLMLGGSGYESDEFVSYTDIELNIIFKILKMLTKNITDAWSKYCSIDAEFERHENSSQHIQIAAPNDIIAIITLKAEIAGKEGFINFCVPHMLVEPVLKSITNRQGFTKTHSADDISYDEILKKKITNSNINVLCRLGKSHLTIGEINRMQVGDVIILKTKVSDKAEMLINDVPKYLCDLGVRNRKYAVKLGKLIEGD